MSEMPPWFPRLFVFLKMKSLRFVRPIPEGHSPRRHMTQQRAGEVSSRTEAPIHYTVMQFSTHTEGKSRMFSRSWESQLKEFQLPKSYTERFALNPESTKGRGLQFVLKVFLLRKWDFR